MQKKIICDNMSVFSLTLSRTMGFIVHNKSDRNLYLLNIPEARVNEKNINSMFLYNLSNNKQFVLIFSYIVNKSIGL